eukprot:g3574.t1
MAATSRTTNAAAATTIDTDVVVIGGGFGGLSAATALQASGLRVVVLEAGAAVGGRSKDYVASRDAATGRPTAVVEEGVQFIGTREEEPHAHELLVDDLGLALYNGSSRGDPNPNATFQIRNIKGQVCTTTSFLKFYETCGAGIFGDVEFIAKYAEFAAWASELDVTKPWAHPRAKEWDAMTAESWIHSSTLSQTAKTYLYRILSSGALDAPETVSLLHLLFLGVGYLKGSYDTFRVVEGTNAAAQMLRRRIEAAKVVSPGGQQSEARAGGRVLLNSPVAALDYDPRPAAAGFAVNVSTSSGLKVRAKRAVLAGSPVGLRRIVFRPPLPVAKARLMQHMYVGVAARFYLIYPRQFWVQERNATGTIVDGTENSAIVYFLDATPRAGTPATMEAWLTGTLAADLLEMEDPGARARAVAEHLVPFLGDEARNFVDHHFVDFGKDPYIGGGFTAMFPPGVWTRYGQELNTTVGPLSWAGGDWTFEKFGRLDGAI